MVVGKVQKNLSNMRFPCEEGFLYGFNLFALFSGNDVLLIDSAFRLQGVEVNRWLGHRIKSSPLNWNTTDSKYVPKRKSEYAFDNLGLKTLQIIAHKDNLGSMKVALKNDFKWQRTLENEFAPAGGDPLDMELYELVSDSCKVLKT